MTVYGQNGTRHVAEIWAEGLGLAEGVAGDVPGLPGSGCGSGIGQKDIGQV